MTALDVTKGDLTALPAFTPDWLCTYLQSIALGGGTSFYLLRCDPDDAALESALSDQLNAGADEVIVQHGNKLSEPNLIISVHLIAEDAQLDALASFVHATGMSHGARLVLALSPDMLSRCKQQWPYLNVLDVICDALAKRIGRPVLCEASGPCAGETASGSRMLVVRCI